MLVRLRLFISSYSPLFAAFAIRFHDNRLRGVMALAALGGLCSAVSLIHASKKIEPRQVAPTAVKDLGSEAAGYVAAYLLPFIAVPDPGVADLLAYTVVLCVIGVVFVNSDLVGVNPVLYLLGYRLFRVDGVRTVDGQPAEAVVISHQRVSPGAILIVTDIASGILLALPRRNDDRTASSSG